MASNRHHRRYSTDDGVCINTTPSKWPGVTNLRALLAREKDEDTPKLNILLCEAFVATYMSLFVYALWSCDSHILYRLVGQCFDNSTWSCLFGGGVKKLLRVASTGSQVEVVTYFSYIPFYPTTCFCERFCLFRLLEREQDQWKDPAMVVPRTRSKPLQELYGIL